MEMAGWGVAAVGELGGEPSLRQVGRDHPRQGAFVLDDEDPARGVGAELVVHAVSVIQRGRVGRALRAGGGDLRQTSTRVGACLAPSPAGTSKS